MAEKNNAVCSICGKEYYACLSCKDVMSVHPWKIHTCSAPHYQVYQTVRGFSTGVYSKEEFKSKLKNIDLHDLEDYKEHIKVLIKDALKEPVEEVIEEQGESIAIKEEVAITKKTATSRKKSYKVNEEVE